MSKPAYQLLQQYESAGDMNRRGKPLWEGKSCALEPEYRVGCRDSSGLSAAPLTLREKPVWAGRAKGAWPCALPEVGQAVSEWGVKTICSRAFNQQYNSNDKWNKICCSEVLFVLFGIRCKYVGLVRRGRWRTSVQTYCVMCTSSF